MHIGHGLRRCNGRERATGITERYVSEDAWYPNTQRQLLVLKPSEPNLDGLHMSVHKLAQFGRFGV